MPPQQRQRHRRRLPLAPPIVNVAGGVPRHRQRLTTRPRPESGRKRRIRLPATGFVPLPPATPVLPAPSTPPPAVPLPTGPLIVDEDTLEAVRNLWAAAVLQAPVPLIDDDTLAAVRTLWLAAGSVVPVALIDDDTLAAVRALWSQS